MVIVNVIMRCKILTYQIAGISMDQATSSKTSVFVGAFTNDYQKSVLGKDPDVTLKYMPTGTRYNLYCNFLSIKLIGEAIRF